MPDSIDWRSDGAGGETASNFIATPEMIAAAWDAWAPRHKRTLRLGPGPAFKEAIEAAFRVSARAYVERNAREAGHGE